MTENTFKNSRTTLFSARGVALLALSLVVAGCASAPAPKDASRSERIQSDFALAASLRGLATTNRVAIERETPEALRASLAQELDKKENRAFLAETEDLLKVFRIIRPDDSLKAIYQRVMEQQIAAYYDPAKKRVAYIDGAAGAAAVADFPGMERFVYVHEFCHAVEDGAFDLEHLTQISQSSFDRNLAVTSLVEGNAVLVGMDGLLSEQPMNTATPLGAWLVNLLGWLDTEDAQKEIKDCPPFLSGALVRPYLDGAVFSNRLRREAGWEAINEAYRARVPSTTAEILYPERRYLKAARPADFEPDAALFQFAARGVMTNSLGALGTALWLGGEHSETPRSFGFLEGWMGDRVYLLTDAQGRVATVWVSYWERPGQARAFLCRTDGRLRGAFGDVPWKTACEGRLAVAAWTPGGTPGGCDALAACALRTRVTAEHASLAASWWSELPLPVRFPSYPDVSSGCELLGGYVLDTCGGERFYRVTLGGGLLFRAEANPDRHYVGTLWGLARHVEDDRSDFTYWKLPLLASWYRRGTGAAEHYRWSVLWGLLADGDDARARVLLIPVWKKSDQSPCARAQPHGGCE